MTLPIAISTEQTHLLTAIHALEQGRSETEVGSVLHQTYSYLQPGDVSDIIAIANTLRGQGQSVGKIEASGTLADYTWPTQGIIGNRFAEAQILWIDPSGNTQYRTIRARINESMTPAELQLMLIEQGIALINLQDRTGNDTIGLAPPDGTIVLEILAIL